jgi:arsenite-transporting ATPase
MPALALEWSHRLMRLILKYREVISLGDAAAELLAFAKRTRALDALLRDPARAGLIVVALDEPLVRGESARLVRAAGARGVDVIALLWNRAAEGAAPRALDLPDGAAPVQLTAPVRADGPTGVAALRRWAGEWSLDAPS